MLFFEVIWRNLSWKVGINGFFVQIPPMGLLDPLTEYLQAGVGDKQLLLRLKLDGL